MDEYLDTISAASVPVEIEIYELDPCLKTTIAFSSADNFQQEYLILLSGSEESNSSSEEDSDDSISPDEQAVDLVDQEESITISWPSITYSSDGCPTTLETSITYLGIEKFGQEVHLEDGYLTIDTLSSDLENLTRDELVLVTIDASLVHEIT